MSHVEVKPAAVQEKSPVARWLLIVAIMKIDRAHLRFPKKVILYLRRPGFDPSLRSGATDQAAVFRFDACDPVHFVPTMRHTPRRDKRERTKAMLRRLKNEVRSLRGDSS